MFLGEDEPDFEIAQASLLSAEQGTTQGVLSGLVMAETMGAPRIRVGTATDRDERLLRVARYFAESRFLYVEESRRAGERSMQIAIEHGLKGADALHIALAELAQCEEFYSLDHKHLRIGTTSAGLVVRRPRGEVQGELAVEESSDPDA